MFTYSTVSSSLTVLFFAKVKDVDVKVFFELKVKIYTFLFIFRVYQYFAVFFRGQLIYQFNESSLKKKLVGI